MNTTKCEYKYTTLITVTKPLIIWPYLTYLTIRKGAITEGGHMRKLYEIAVIYDPSPCCC